MSDPFPGVPGTYGAPVLGSTLEFVADAEGWATRRYAEHGPVFKTRVLGSERIIFSDPEAVRQVLGDRADNFSSRLGWEWPIGKLFRRGLMLRDFDDHRLHRKVMQFAFRSAAMRQYTEMMAPIIDRHVTAWSRLESLQFYPAVKRLTLEIAAEVFMGEALGPEAVRVNDSLMQAVRAAVAPVRRELPFTQFRRGMAGRRYMVDYFGRRIAAHRADPGPDLLSQLCVAETETGDTLSDQDVVDHMIFLLMAAHDTTTATLATMAWEFSRDRSWQERLRDEINDVGTPVLEWDHRDDHPQIEWVFQEAMRLHPPVPFIPRQTMAGCEIDGTPVPAGSLISVAALLTHRLPRYWKDPARFDPERFERGEHKQHSHLFVPFSGGAHTCLGMHVAGLMTKAILVQALQRLRFSTSPGQVEMIVTVPIPRPRYGLPLRVTVV
jgi:cytochrome P450